MKIDLTPRELQVVAMILKTHVKVAAKGSPTSKKLAAIIQGVINKMDDAYMTAQEAQAVYHGPNHVDEEDE